MDYWMLQKKSELIVDEMPTKSAKHQSSVLFQNKPTNNLLLQAAACLMGDIAFSGLNSCCASMFFSKKEDKTLRWELYLRQK